MAGEKSTTFSGQILALLFNATTIPNVAINATSSPLTNIYLSLHTADPTAAGTQTSSEVTYTSYARVPVARTTGGFSVAAASVTPTGAAGQVATFVAYGAASSGSGELFYATPLSPTITITIGIPPTITTASTVTEA